MLMKGDEIDPRALRAQLYAQLPKRFDPLTIDPRLLISGTRITLLGVWHINPASDLIPHTETIIRSIKEATLAFS